MKLDSKEHYDSLIEITKNDKDIVPIFTKNNEGVLEIISAFNNDFTFEKGSKLVYLGKRIK